MTMRGIHQSLKDQGFDADQCTKISFVLLEYIHDVALEELATKTDVERRGTDVIEAVISSRRDIDALKWRIDKIPLYSPNVAEAHQDIRRGFTVGLICLFAVTLLVALSLYELISDSCALQTIWPVRI